MAGDFKLKPLSSGIGLGSVRSAGPKKFDQRSGFKPSATTVKKFPVAPPRQAPPMQPLAQPPMQRSAIQQTRLDINPSLEMKSAKKENPIKPSTKQNHAARTAYYPHSQAQVMRNAPQTRIVTWWVKGVIGWGLDLFVVVLSTIICSVLATLAWRFGKGIPDGADPYSAVADLINAGIDFGPIAVLGLFVAAFVAYYGSMRLIAGSTLGGALRQQ